MTVTLAQGAGSKRTRCYCVFTTKPVASFAHHMKNELILSAVVQCIHLEGKDGKEAAACLEMTY